MHLTLHRPLLKIFRVNAFLQKWAAQVAPYYYIVASCVPHNFFSEFRAFFVHVNLPLFFNSSKSLIKTIPLHTRSIDCNEPLVFISLMIRSTFDSEVIFIFYASNQWRWPLCPHFKIASQTSQLRTNSPCSELRTNSSCSVVHSRIAFAA